VEKKFAAYNLDEYNGDIAESTPCPRQRGTLLFSGKNMEAVIRRVENHFGRPTWQTSFLTKMKTGKNEYYAVMKAVSEQ
jgi:hypothetical protein